MNQLPPSNTFSVTTRIVGDKKRYVLSSRPVVVGKTPKQPSPRPPKFVYVQKPKREPKHDVIQVNLVTMNPTEFVAFKERMLQYWTKKTSSLSPYDRACFVELANLTQQRTNEALKALKDELRRMAGKVVASDYDYEIPGDEYYTLRNRYNLNIKEEEEEEEECELSDCSSSI